MDQLSPNFHRFVILCTFVGIHQVRIVFEKEVNSHSNNKRLQLKPSAEGFYLCTKGVFLSLFSCNLHDQFSQNFHRFFILSIYVGTHEVKVLWSLTIIAKTCHTRAIKGKGIPLVITHQMTGNKN